MNRKIRIPYGSRSSTQDFLLRRSNVQAPEKEKGQSAVGLKELSARFPRMRMGKAFVDDALGHLDAFLRFGILLIRMDDFTQTEKNRGREYAIRVLLDTASAIDAVCCPAKGMWGLIERDMFGCFFPDENASVCTACAENIRKSLGKIRQQSLSAGIAEYPLAHFSRMESLHNARKALEQAELSGAGGTALFDAITLNMNADRLYQQGNVKGAIAEFKSALMLSPSEGNLHNSLGVCYSVLGAYPSALEEFRTAAQLLPDEPMPVYNTGLVHLLKGEKDLAMENFLKAHAIGPNVFEILFQLGKLFLDRGEAEKSKLFFQKSLEIRPASGSAWRYMGKCCAVLGQTDKAIAAYRQAIRLKPDDAISLSALGWLYDLRGENPDIALSFCRHSVQIAPGNGLFRQRLGRVYLRLGLPDEALTEFETADRLGCESEEYIRRIHSMRNRGQ
ncbi:MAG: tetratricopeptide repeat protein [Desulfobacterales bacterium]